MSDGLDAVFNKFSQQRTKPLAQRFHGRYRAVVVETNDPLRIYRIRFKCPELHDADLKPEECPWAVPSSDMGNFRSGRWTHPCIGDLVFIEFEKNHPYGPIWSGHATPTRRKAYVYASLYGPTPVPVDEQSDLVTQPNDFNEPYLPKDQRPMSHGWSDRYGSLDITNSVGYFPAQHNVKPPPPDIDNLTSTAFAESQSKPVANSPDSKFMARLSKYGNLILQSDIGYTWQQDKSNGEFVGDFAQDEQWEINRWAYWQRVLHEDAPSGRDQRRILAMTRYGSRLEMRDVGWAHTREGEFDTQKVISSGDRDERWVKLRTKGGHLIEQIDIGFDEKDDEFVKRLIINEVAASTPLDREDKFGADARQIRIVTRTGRKFVLDDRFSDRTKAQDHGLPNTLIGLGWLLKGRATPGARCDYAGLSGDPRGYFFQANERPGKNHTVWGSPLGQLIEINDNDESIVVCSRLPSLPMPCKFLDDNEFLNKSAFDLTPQKVTHHLILDLQREIVRLKSRAAHGQAPRCPVFGPAANGLQSGLEIHDAPIDNPWVELVDHDHRGLWFSRKQKLGIWRARSGIDMYQWMHESDKVIVIRNGENGKVQIMCGGNVEIISRGNTSIQASKLITMKAPNGIHMQVGGARYRFGRNAFDTNVDVRCRDFWGYYPQIHDGSGPPPGAPSGQGANVSNIKAIPTPTHEPSNRL